MSLWLKGTAVEAMAWCCGQGTGYSKLGAGSGSFNQAKGAFMNREQLQREAEEEMESRNPQPGGAGRSAARLVADALCEEQIAVRPGHVDKVHHGAVHKLPITQLCSHT